MEEKGTEQAMRFLEKFCDREKIKKENERFFGKKILYRTLKGLFFIPEKEVEEVITKFIGE